MSTPCYIGIVEPVDGSVKAVRCSFDGYLIGGVGEMLLEHYSQSEAKIRELISLGNLLSLGREIGEKHPRKEHIYNSEWCLFHKRDLDVKWDGWKAKTFISKTAFLRDSEAWELKYLYDNGLWYTNYTGVWELLSHIIAKELLAENY